MYAEDLCALYLTLTAFLPGLVTVVLATHKILKGGLR